MNWASLFGAGGVDGGGTTYGTSGGGGGGGVYDISSSASSRADQRSGAISVGGFNTGTQGIGTTQMAIIAAVVAVVVLFVARRR